ncbi:MAG: hypothetical protein GWN00_10900, partial [Aliifodinibius sp.]|nr:hypothetical protein [Fodinibius sp.]NIY25294.1 hypothetical protein [Fodinibius sp.]
ASTITTPTAQHSSDVNTLLLLHFDPLNDLLDSGNTVHTITSVNGAHITGPFPPSSVAGRMTFDGVDDDITIPQHSDFDLTADLKTDYTIQFWVRHNALGATQT